mmetsp:Transcript_23956/g.52389  ORF Transcript_23956/g.52389 Transcript_23956/m.52389 type:complete len:129 (+) Transcript_23956:2221-2607(+)
MATTQQSFQDSFHAAAGAISNAEYFCTTRPFWSYHTYTPAIHPFHGLIQNLFFETIQIFITQLSPASFPPLHKAIGMGSLTRLPRLFPTAQNDGKAKQDGDRTPPSISRTHNLAPYASLACNIAISTR